MQPAEKEHCLVVDDETHLREALVWLLKGAGYPVRAAANGEEAVRAMEEKAAELVISDVRMPKMDGTELLAVLRRRWPDAAVIMVTVLTDVEMAVRCIHQGALDYIVKPFQIQEVLVRVMQALEKRRLKIEVREYQHTLEDRVQELARRNRLLLLEAVQALAHALEAKDAYTRGHSQRVATYASATAARLGLDAATQAEIRLGGELHDIGKIGVREGLLLKTGRLTPDEYRHVMDHTVIGERILTPLLHEHPLVLQIVRSHHERLDGNGLPDSLCDGRIPQVARIVAVADAFDAMTSGRPYRPARSPADALEEMHRSIGSQLDGDAVHAFECSYREAGAARVAPVADRPARSVHA